MHCKKFGRRPSSHGFWEIFEYSDEENKNFSENCAVVICGKISCNEKTSKQGTVRLSSSHNLRFPISANKTFVVMKFVMLFRGYMVEGNIRFWALYLLYLNNLS